MISYELAIKLKEAGFPQTSPREVYCIECKEEAMYARCYKHQKEYIVYPTLSELIESCGDDFIGLMRSDDLKEWRALCPIEIGINVAYDASSAEEAVANLWLTLQNGKQKSTKE